MTFTDLILWDISKAVGTVLLIIVFICIMLMVNHVNDRRDK